MLDSALRNALKEGVEGAEIEQAGLKLRAKRDLEAPLVAILERLSLANPPLLQALLRKNLHTLRAVTDADAAALGDAGAPLFSLFGRLREAARLQVVTVDAGARQVSFDQLVMGERIGKGSFGTVHAVTLDGQSLALKRIPLTDVPGPERPGLLANHQKETRALSQLSQANIVALHGAVVDVEDEVGLLMELARRGSLRELLDREPAQVTSSAAVQMQLASGVAAGMKYLHAQPVLHHDLKTSNVLVFDGAAGGLVPKLTDFGLAVVAAGSTLGTKRAAAGTTAYKAPEQFDDEFSAASEIYSYAIVLWELLHGGRPWHGKTEAGIIGAVLRGQRPSVTVADGVLLQLAEACWAPEPADRPSFAAVVTQLAAAQRTFATSRYKELYDATPLVEYQHVLLGALEGLVRSEARRLGVPQERAKEAFLELQRNAFTCVPDGLTEALNPDQLRKLTARIWSSAVVFEGNDHWPCKLLQQALRNDDVVKDAVVFARALNSFVGSRAPETPSSRRPQAHLPARTFRGGTLPRHKRWFFTVGKQYRAPSFLSTSTNLQKAREFMQQTGADKRPNGVSREDAALWTFEFDTFLGCKHVNLIDRHDGSLRDANGDVIDANSPAEAEWLFSPYSARPHAQTRDRANTDSLFESNAVV